MTCEKQHSQTRTAKTNLAGNTRIAYTGIASAPQTVVEMPNYLRDVAKLFTQAEQAQIAAFIGANPEAGDVMAGTGGIRKLRWAFGSRGKSAGVRIIYYFHGASIPIFLLNVFAKNEKSNLTHAERNALKKLTEYLASYAE